MTKEEIQADIAEIERVMGRLVGNDEIDQAARQYLQRVIEQRRALLERIACQPASAD